ncbi:D-glycero-alpha-D-manno-heptose-1,7-bisphosphate 7-phosphatase [Sulfuricurvum sp.]|uniref:D-glycero-alpha-D-manno-heptose-1,7-bisphosphate 7-phosphatase n=1 Tax=Sulfuricurvum sp. TaxID=2025608 RepID=UPI003566D194
MQQAIFLDRDGTITQDDGHTYKIEDLKFLPGAKAAIKFAHDMGFLVIVVSNQSGVGRGYYTIEDVLKFENAMQEELKEYGTTIDKFYYCFHDTAIACACRKPKPYLLNEAKKYLLIDMQKSFMIGDTISDLRSGHSAGCRTILVRTGCGSEVAEDALNLHFPVIVVDNIFMAIRKIEIITKTYNHP